MSAYVRIRPYEPPTIWVKYKFAGLHCWPEAPASRSYLADSHHHVFHVRVEVTVEHDDREIEFHDLRDVVGEACDGLGNGLGIPYGIGTMRDLGPMSCEMAARSVAAVVMARWPGRFVACEISEDDECGARVVAKPDGTPRSSAYDQEGDIAASRRPLG